MGKRVKIERVGEKLKNKQGLKMEIIEYYGVENITVLFEDGTVLKNKAYRAFLKGGIANPFHPTFSNIGYLGIGKHRTGNDPITNSWSNMLKRCTTKFDENSINHVYNGCTVCEEWLNFQNFAEWYEENKWGNLSKYQVDKDILIKGNKIYSPETCVLVDNKLNTLFIKSDKIRGDLPIGVHKDSYGNYIAQCNNIEKRYLGYFKNPEDAFYCYKSKKEKYIKEVANHYKNNYDDFPQNIYKAMVNYEVEIDD